MRVPAPALLAALLLLAGCKVDLYSHLSERDAVEMQAVLLERGIDAVRVVAKDGTSTIQVEKERLAAAVDLLRASMLPRPTFATMADVFAPQGLVSSPVTERARFIYALSQELSQTISQFDGVLSARVHVVLPHNDPLRQDSVPAAASVFVRYDSGVSASGILPQVKMLVANSIEGLAYDKVSVVLLPVARAPITLPLRAEAAPEPSFDLAGNGLAIGSAAAALIVLCGAAALVLLRRRRKGPARAAAPAALPKPAVMRVAS